MTPFDDPYRLIPEPRRIAEADSFDDVRAMYADAQTLVDEHQSLRQDIRDKIRRHQRLSLRIRRARDVLEGRGSMKAETFPDAETDRQRAARETLDEIVPEAESLFDEIRDLQDRREQLARRIDRDFVAVRLDRERPELPGVDESAVRDQVGRPAEMGV